MEHSFAVEHKLVEQYLLKDISPEMRDEFEDHYFGCRECAADLLATQEFLQYVRAELARPHLVSHDSAAREAKRRTQDGIFHSLLHWRPALAIVPLAASLMLAIYQNAVTLPKLRSELAMLTQPEVVPSLSLAGGNSRGAAMPSIALHGAQTLLLQLDIPAQDRFTSYTCELYSPSQQRIWSLSVPAAQTIDTVSLQVPFGSQSVSGTYSLKVSGVQGASNTGAVELVTYTFNVAMIP